MRNITNKLALTSVTNSEKPRVKSLIISQEVHDKLKKYCKVKNKGISQFIEALILNHINNNLGKLSVVNSDVIT